MQMALVQGKTTSTVKHQSLTGNKLLICQPLGINQQAVGDPVIVIDQLGAGAGDHVIITSDGLGLRKMLRDNKSPARWWTMGIIDQFTVYED
jgi:ethanolamine utilization protein EutN